MEISLAFVFPSSFLGNKSSLLQFGLGALVKMHCIGTRANQRNGDCDKQTGQNVYSHHAYFTTGKVILGKHVLLFRQSYSITV